MPKSTNPSVLQAGIGQEPFTQTNYALSAGPLAPRILVASPAQKHDSGVDPTFMLAAHVRDPHAAHAASAVSVEDAPAGTFTSDNVQGVLLELASLRPPMPGGIGEVNPPVTATTGIPDWGTLSLRDGPQSGFTLTGQTTKVSNLYPYYWTPPIPGNRTKISQLGYFEPPAASAVATQTEYDALSGTTLTAQWNAGGNSPRDTVFNVVDPVGNYDGGGEGQAATGAFNRGGATVQTYRIVRTDPLATVQPVVVTGVICPADRGVVALIHWPAGGDITAFAAQLPEDKVVAAIVLGQGLYDSGTCPTDGEPGGLFLTGLTGGQYDPYAFPGQATGQAGLAEIYRGVAATFSDATTTDTQGGGVNFIFKPTSPYWNFDGRVSAVLTISATLAVIPGVTTQITTTAPHNYKVGQPITVDNCLDINGGLEITATVESIVGPTDFVLWVSGATNAGAVGTTQRITGCDADDYSSTEGPPFPGQVRYGTLTGSNVAGGLPILGAPYLDGAVRGTAVPTAPTTSDDLDNNFFQYRLPVLSDYSTGPTGLKYTPVLEKPRYFSKPTLADTPLVDLTTAGNYSGLSSQDYYPMQVARFRHRFEVTAGPGPLTDAGSYMLLHFKKETYFEDLVLRDIWPTDDKLYSANIADPAAVTAATEGLDDTQTAVAKNMIDQTDIEAAVWGPNGSISGKPFWSLCNTVVLDQTEAVLPIPSGNQYTFGVAPGPGPDFVTVSGIRYLLPRTALGVAGFFVVNPSVTVGDLFGNGVGDSRAFQTGLPNGSFDNQRIMNQSPLILSLGDFSTGSTHTSSVTTDVWKHWQRLEFDLEAISAGDGVGGTAPAFGDNATIPALSIQFSGDATTAPVFSADAKPHAFVRMPLFDSLADLAVLNATAAIDLPEASGDAVLFHSATPEVASNPQYGNFITGAVGTPALATTMTDTKDVVEVLVDEVYRYRLDFGAVPTPAGLENICGPGLPVAAAAIEVPVQAGVAATFGGIVWEDASWIQSTAGIGPDAAFTYPVSIAAAGTLLDQEIQVGGLPHRNPPVTVGVAAPKPSAGILLYPKTDYDNGHIPGGGTLGNQPDYSVSVNDRSYVRAFDAAFSRSATPVAADNQPFVTLRVDGVRQSDFAYTGGATPGSASMAILVKVPGLTTWMDIGRPDGAGPSKQDALQDGAGCFVAGLETFEATDPTYGHWYCQVKINVGPVANLFESVLDPQCAGEVPVLVKVVYYDPAVGGDADLYDFLYDFNTLALNENAPPTDVRGIIGIQVVRPA